MSRTKTVLVIAAISLVVAFLPLLISAEGEQISFSEESSQVVLQYFVTGTYRTHDVLFTVYGDGRLVYQQLRLTTQQVLEEKETQIGRDGVDQLLQTYAVEHNLLACGADCIGAKVMNEIGSEKVPQSRDGSEVVITLDLLVDQGDGSGTSPLQQEIRLHSVGMLSRICPEIREIQGVQNLGKALWEYANEGGAA